MFQSSLELEWVTGRSHEIRCQEKKKGGRMPYTRTLPPFLKTYKYFLGLLSGLAATPDSRSVREIR